MKVLNSAFRSGRKDSNLGPLALLLAMAILLFPTQVFGQSNAAPKSDQGAAKPASAPLLEPVFPNENRNLVYVEGEDAVVTNFDKQPILNYSASGLRTLQLNSSADPTGDSGYYADYVFYVDQPGTYEFWYGGTPPGPSESSKPSYSSPFEYTLDGESTVSVYAENVSVGSSYTPLFYWNRVGKVTLSAGRHQIRFQVTEKRRYDGKYLFYLDSFFFVREQNGKVEPGEPLPQVFPASLAQGSPGEPFKYIEDYLIEIRDHPANIQAYIDLSLAYALVGDNLSALKYLNRAAELDPQNDTVLLLKAKNLLWKGDVTNGLAAYRDLLKRDPKKLNLWAEAGKVAAWSGRYSDSISFFDDGLKQFPNNLNLLVNLGLTYLWSGDAQKAQTLFEEARTTVADNYSGLMQLARYLSVAQAFDRAVEVYKTAIKTFPKNLEAYLLLEKLYVDTGKSAEADAVRKQIADTFQQSPRLSSFLELAQTKQNLKNQLLATFEQNLAKQPDNLGLRELLARAYFWNGMQQKGTAEYLSILVNHTYRKLKEVDANSTDLLTLIDRSYVLAQYFQTAPGEAQRLGKSLSDDLSAYKAAAKELSDYQNKLDAARQKGQTIPQPSGGDPQAKVTAANEKVAGDIAAVQAFLNAQSGAQDELSKDQKLVARIQSKAEADQKAFEKLTASSKWHWRVDDTKLELQQATNSGAALAGFATAKIDQIQGRLSSAADIFRKLAASGDPRYQFELSQTLLWMGNLDQAKQELAKLPGDSSERTTIGQWTALEKSLTPKPAPAGYAGSTPNEALIQDLSTRLEGVGASSRSSISAVTTLQSTMHAILQDRLVRAIYQNQEDTFQLRGDLGDYYLTQKKFDDAIRQFRQVLAIDPWNIGALFRLGQVYAMKGNWKQALANYEKVYYSDPTYENVAHQYNELARQHPDSLSLDVQTTADTQRTMYQASASYSTNINSAVGFSLSYLANTQRLFVPPSPELPSSFRTSTAFVGVPLDIYGLRLKLTPKVGATLLNRLDDNSVAQAVPTSSSLLPGAFFGYLKVDPTFALEAQLTVGKYLYITGNYTYERQPETYVPSRIQYNIFDNSGELNATANLGFIGVYPFKDSSFRVYGRIDLLSDSNYTYTALGELTLGLLNRPKTSTQLSLVGSAQLQDSKTISQPSYLYYAPRGELVAGGGVSGSTWLPVGNDSIGLSLRAIASSYMQRVFSPADLTKMLQLSGEGRVEYDRGNAAVYLASSFSATYQYSPILAPPQSPWNYWSMTVSLGYSAQLPSLLAP